MGSRIPKALCKLVFGRDRTLGQQLPGRAANRFGEYTTKGLFESLERPLGAEAWPKSAKGFADALRRIAPALRTCGIEVVMLGKRGGHTRVMLRQTIVSKQSHASHECHDAAAPSMTCMTSKQDYFCESSAIYARASGRSDEFL
jgi:hypothetical protein